MAAPRDYPTPRGAATAHPHDQRFASLRPGVLARDRMTCWLCGHPDRDASPPGRNLGLDHVVPLAECAVQVPPVGPYDFANLRAAHVKPCPVCTEAAGRPIRCNAIRGALSPEAAREKLRRYTGLPIGTAARPDGAAGERDWGV